MKIVVNRCFGGASLSPLGVKRALENGVPLDSWEFNKPNSMQYEENPKPTQDLGNGFFVYGSSLFTSVVKDGLAYTEHLSFDIELRSHPGLVKTIEELGTVANSRFSELEIVDVPDGIKVQIENYDGMEHVAEVHRTW